MIDVARLDPQVGDFLDGLQPIAAELGPAATLAIVRHYGGARLYVPRRWTEALELNETLGVDVARALCAGFGPERIDIPRNPFTVAALRGYGERLRREGLSNGQIARALGLSWRTVTRLTGATTALPRARRRVDERQIDIEEFTGRR